MRPTLRPYFFAPVLMITLALPSTAAAVGVGFGYEFHQLMFAGGGDAAQSFKAEFPVRRYVLIDTSGLLVGIFLTLGSGLNSLKIDRTREVSPTKITETTTYSHDGTGIRPVDVRIDESTDDTPAGRPVRTAIRLTIEYATSSNAEGDVQAGTEEMHGSKVDFSEVRFTVGGTAAHTAWTYIDLNFIDLIWRDLRFAASRAPILDRFLWQVDVEYGVGFDGYRAGLFLEYDMIAGIEAAFSDDISGGYVVGVVGRLNTDHVSFEAKLKEYALPSQIAPNADVNGRALTLFGTLEF